jgi:hypothetical protein
MAEVKGAAQAHALAASLYTPRTVRLETFEHYTKGTQYEGREDFLSPSRDVPLLERAPTIVYPVVESAIRQHVDMALGEGRFPKLTTGIGEDEEDDLFGLSEDDSETLDTFIANLSEHARFVDVCQDALEAAEGIGSACVVYSFDGCGYLKAEHVETCHAEPTFDTSGALVRLEIKYPFVELYAAEEGKVRARCMFYRRVIDAVSDTVYKPAEVQHKGIEPSGTVDKDRTVEHGLGFVPCVWYAYKRKWARAGECDGRPIHAALLDEIDALNFGLSQRHRASLYSGDPQMVETGVGEGEQVAPSGSQPRASLKELRNADGSVIYGFGYSERPRSARRKGAGTVWRYENPDAKVEMLTLPGDALTAISEHCEDLLDKIEGVLGYTGTSPEQVKGALSGKALGFLFARTTSFVDRVRQDFWHGFMVPSLSLMMRMAFVAHTASPGSVYISGIKKAAPIMTRFMREVDGAGLRWFSPRIKPVWGAYFEQSAEDEAAVVNTAAMAFEKGLMTRTLAIEKLRGVFVFQSAAEIAEQLEEEAAKKQEEALALMATKPTPGEKDDKKPNGGSGKQDGAEGDKPGLPELR